MPSKYREKDINCKQLTFRIMAEDKIMLLKLLRDSGMSFQGFVQACIEAYLRGDPKIMKAAQDFKELQNVSKKRRDECMLSHRERQDLLDELDKNTPLQGGRKRRASWED